MNKPAWIIRTYRQNDSARLRSFNCASAGTKWQVEVEQFVRNQLHDWAIAPVAKAKQDSRVILLICRSSRDLVGVAAHELASLASSDGTTFVGTKIEVVAVSSNWQGRTFSSGERASDVLMSAVMHDIATRRRPPRSNLVFAVVHKDNTRSIAMCQRHGFDREMTSPNSNYRRLLT
jgi:hypothetical protein